MKYRVDFSFIVDALDKEEATEFAIIVAYQDLSREHITAVEEWDEDAAETTELDKAITRLWDRGDGLLRTINDWVREDEESNPPEEVLNG
jgi:hypothetical protein